MTTTSAPAARVGIVAVLAYQLLAAALIVIRPELDPSWQPISEYAIGRLGWIMVLAFLASAVSYAALYLAIRPHLRGAAGRLGLGLLLVCVTGTVGVGIFVSDPIVTPPAEWSAVGTLHAICGLVAMTLLPVAALLINMNLVRHNPAFRMMRRPLLWTAWLPLAGLLIMWVWVALVTPFDAPNGPGVNVGWPGRFVFLTYAGWLITLAISVLRMSSMARSSARALGDVVA